MKEFFEPKPMRADTLAVIETANVVLDDYRRQGYRLTIRQLYYRFVAKKLFPAGREFRKGPNDKWIKALDGTGGTVNADPNYKWLAGIMTDGRVSGLVDWDMIEDRGRGVRGNSHWMDAKDFSRSCALAFRQNLWLDQPWHVEVMIEKQALEGVTDRVCREEDTDYTSNKGYSSCTAMRDAGRRLNIAMQDGKDVAIIYVGDHDPSGIDMTRDIEERLKLYSGYHRWTDDEDEKGGFRFEDYPVYEFKDRRFEVNRVALNIDQVRRYNPPPDPAKAADSRSGAYIAQFGTSCWELDALEPAVLAGLIRDGIRQYRDDDLYNAAKDRQDKTRAKIAAVVSTIADVDNEEAGNGA